MLAPAGDQKNRGRDIGDSFERSLTTQWADVLKKNIEFSDPTIKVLLSHNTSQMLEPLHNVYYANRVNPNLYISLHCYQVADNKPMIFVYAFENNLGTFTYSETDFIPLPHAHYKHREKTRTFNQKLITDPILKNHFFAIKNVAIPFKPLFGISCPAIALEIGLPDNDIKKYADILTQPLVNAIRSCL